MKLFLFLLFFVPISYAQELFFNLEIPLGSSVVSSTTISPDPICFYDDANFPMSYDQASGDFTFNPPSAGRFYFTALPCAGASFSYAMVHITAGEGVEPPIEPPVEPPTEPPTTSSDERRVHFFGHSLIFEEDQNVPYWMNQLATLGGRNFAASGEYGFFPTVPATNVLGWPGVPVAWDNDFSVITDAVFTVYNFGLSCPPTEPCYGSEVPSTAVINAITWVKEQNPDAKIWIYESWADGGYIDDSIPMSASNLIEYHNFNLDVNQQWYDDLMTAIHVVHPDAKLMPVARLISSLAIDQFSFSWEDLYVDSAPHGTPNTYFLAALVSYISMYDDFVERMPTGDLSSQIINDYPKLVYYIKDRL